MAKKIAQIEIEGVIENKNETYNQKWLLETIDDLKDDKKIAAVVLKINSPGGGVYQSAEVFDAVMRLREKSKKIVWAYFASLAASGGYYIGCSADKIVANQNTLTGSIGVIAGRFLDLTRLMEHHGVKEELIHAGRNKIMGHFSTPATEEQRAIMQKIADECYDDFVKLVSTRRNLDEEKVRTLADGRIYTARQALEAGLVDKIANFEDAMDELKKEIGNEKAQIQKFAPKKKHSIKSLLNGFSTNGNLMAATELLKSKTPYPAYFWDGGQFFGR